MCNRYSVTNPSGIKARFKIRDSDFSDVAIRPKFNLAPTEEGPTIIQEGDERQLQPMLFGLIPSWAKDAKIATQCLNARAETIQERPAYRTLFKKRRCLVVADGFYEWVADGKKKRPRRIVLKDHGLFAFAGVWDTWKNAQGREFKSFAIVTTESNDLIRPIHDRMPVILREEDEALWLAPYVTEAKTLLPLLKPYPSEQMEMFSVDAYVNKAGNEGPKCIERLPASPELF